MGHYVQLPISAVQILAMPAVSVTAIILYPVYPMDHLVQQIISAVPIPVMPAVSVEVTILYPV